MFSRRSRSQPECAAIGEMLVGELWWRDTTRQGQQGAITHEQAPMLVIILPFVRLVVLLLRHIVLL